MLRVGADDGRSTGAGFAAAYEFIGHSLAEHYDRAARLVGNVRLAWQLYHLSGTASGKGREGNAAVPLAPQLPQLELCSESETAEAVAKSAKASAVAGKIRKALARQVKVRERATQISAVVSIVKLARS